MAVESFGLSGSSDPSIVAVIWETGLGWSAMTYRSGYPALSWHNKGACNPGRANRPRLKPAFAVLTVSATAVSSPQTAVL